MRSFLSFARETLIGGILFLLPLGTRAAGAGQALQLAKPVGTAIHDTFFPWAHTDLAPFLFAVLNLVVIAFGAGLFARSRAGRHIFGGIEALILERLPLYTIFRQMITDMAGAERLSGAATTRSCARSLRRADLDRLARLNGSLPARSWCFFPTHPRACLAR